MTDSVRASREATHGVAAGAATKPLDPAAARRVDALERYLSARLYREDDEDETAATRRPAARD